MSRVNITRDEALLAISEGKEVYATVSGQAVKLTGYSATALAKLLSNPEVTYSIDRVTKLAAEGSFFVKEGGKIRNIRVHGVFELGKEPRFEVINWDDCSLRPAISLNQAIKSTSVEAITSSDRTLLAKSDAAAERARQFFKQQSINYRTLSLDTRESPAKWRVELTAYGALIYANHGWAIATRHEVQGYTRRKKFVDAVNEARYVTNVVNMRSHLRSRGFDDLVNF